MPDLSADRPLLHSKSDLVALEAELDRLIGSPNQIDTANLADALLDFLAARSRLLSPDAEHREEWNVRLPKPGGYSVVDGSMTKRWPPEPGEVSEDVAWWKDHAGVDVIPVKRTVSEFADGSWFMGPWVEVDPNE